jgi:hypothetical protein
MRPGKLFTISKTFRNNAVASSPEKFPARAKVEKSSRTTRRAWASPTIKFNRAIILFYGMVGDGNRQIVRELILEGKVSNFA